MPEAVILAAGARAAGSLLGMGMVGGSMTRRGSGMRASLSGALISAALAIVACSGCSTEFQAGQPGVASEPPPSWPAWPGSALALAGIPAEMGPQNGRHWWLTQPRVTGAGALASSGDPAYQVRLIAPPCRKSVTATVAIDGRDQEVTATAAGTVIDVPADAGPHQLRIDISTDSCTVRQGGDPRDFYAGLLLELLPSSGTADPGVSRNSA